MIRSDWLKLYLGKSPSTVCYAPSVFSAYWMKSTFVGMLFIVVLCHGMTAQIVVGTGMVVTGTGDKVITVDTTIVIQGSLNLQDDCELRLLNQGEITTTNDLDVPILTMKGEDYEMHGNWFISKRLALIDGTLTPGDDGKLQVHNNVLVTSANGSHINGLLFHERGGMKFYPVGVDGIYAPMYLVESEGGDDLVVGVEVFNEDLTVLDYPDGIVDASHHWYWKTHVEGAFDGAFPRLPIMNEDRDLMEDIDALPRVLVADPLVMDIQNIGGDYLDSDVFVTSEEKTTGENLLLGFIPDEDPIIHNIITLGEDSDNPYLIIEHVDLISRNTVTLIDRWGNVVYQKKNFKSFNDSSRPYSGEFDDIPSGNYVCLLEYKGKSISQMISIIKE